MIRNTLQCFITSVVYYYTQWPKVGSVAPLLGPRTPFTTLQVSGIVPPAPCPPARQAPRTDCKKGDLLDTRNKYIALYVELLYRIALILKYWFLFFYPLRFSIIRDNIILYCFVVLSLSRIQTNAFWFTTQMFVTILFTFFGLFK